MTYDNDASFRQALEQRLKRRAEETGTDLNRLRRRVVFERFLARLEHDQPGRWVVKGGMALEIRLGDQARMTRDLDLAVVAEGVDGDSIRADLIAALDHDPTGDRFRFGVGPATALQLDEASRPGWRFRVEAELAGRSFANVRVDVVARPEEISATERIKLPSLLSFAGIEGVEVDAVNLAQHFAEKLHAFTRTYDSRPNTRVRDLPDLLILIHDGLDPATALAATEHVFAVRATHEVPNNLDDPPPFWSQEYEGIANDLDLPEKVIESAMETLRGFWARATKSEV